jgi:urea carboxylase
MNAPLRWELRRAADALGIEALLGGPQPAGSRIAVLVGDGAVLALEDRSARWRGRLLWSEPAQLEPDTEAQLRSSALALAARFSGSRLWLEFDVDDGSLALLGCQQADGTARAGYAATIHIGEPAAIAERIAGTLMQLDLPEGSLCAHAIGERIDQPAWYPLVRIPAPDRAALALRINAVRIAGVPTTLALLRQALSAAGDRRLRVRDLDALPYAPCAIEVLSGGLHTTLQDWPGRLGYWAVGVPPSGPMDDLGFRLANRLVGNPDGAPGLEVTLSGPTLRFHAPAIIALAGCAVKAQLDGVNLPMWRAVAVPAGALLRIAGPTALGVRCALAVRGGLDATPYLGSTATFDLGGFGGGTGRPLAAGDWLPLVRAVPAGELASCPRPLPPAARPQHTRTWEIGVLEGPHAAPEFLTTPGMRAFYATAWTVHTHSNRTGIRLVGPKPLWARSDGGEAGLHPSNIHDNAYAFGSVDLTGDMPIILGPDGPSCGGFVCPMVVASAERWKLGQLRPGDTLRFSRLTMREAASRGEDQRHLLSHLSLPIRRHAPRGEPDPAVITRRAAAKGRPAMCLRRAGDDFVLLEYGPAELDLALRLRVELLDAALRERRIAGIIDVVPGVRSLQIHHDPQRLPQHRVVDLLLTLDAALPGADSARVPSRTVHLPLSWDDPATREAIRIYMHSVRADAPWCPWNIEFIRRINGLDSVDTVRRIVFDAEYLVLGLGDVYLGAPVSTPTDPRHRLVTTKYNPARTWTPENAVGIGGAYMCIYGMEGPGGYQFVGRTVPVWRRFGAEQGALLRNFDRLRWYPVGAEELLDLRSDCAAGRWQPQIEDGVFDGGAHAAFLAEQAEDIADFRAKQRAAFAGERKRWETAS